MAGEALKVGRVMVIDDDVLFLRAMQRSALVSRQIDLRVLSPPDLPLEQIGTDGTNLVVVDLFMPGISGLEVCRQIRAHAPKLTIMLASSQYSAEVRTEALRAGATDALQKPYNVATLIAFAEGAMATAGCTRDALITANLELARRMARELSRRYHSLLGADEIEALADLGLCEAAQTFDPSRAESFAAFAKKRIRGSVIDEVRRLSTHTRSRRRLLHRIARVRHELELMSGRASDDRIAALLGVSLEQIVTAQEPTRVVFAPFEVDSASGDEPPDMLAARAEALALIAGASLRLSAVENAIIVRHYSDEMSFAAIAAELSLSTARVVQLHNRVIGLLRRALAERRER